MSGGVGYTPGPWQWDVAPHGEIRLCTPDRGKLYVMGFERRGMQGAQPRFADWGGGERGRRGGIMRSFGEVGGADHPDARLIAAAPALVEALKETRTDLSILRGNVLCAEGYDPRWEGMSSVVKQWIERVEAALRAAGVEP